MTDLGETPSDGFKIGIAVWGVLRASENSASKILRISKPISNYTWKLSISKFQPRKPLLHKAKMHEAQLELRSQKNNSILQVIFRNLQFKVKQSKRNSIQCFSETLIGEYVLKTLRHSLQQDPRVDFFWTRINSENTLFYLHIKKKNVRLYASVQFLRFFRCMFVFFCKVLCLLNFWKKFCSLDIRIYLMLEYSNCILFDFFNSRASRKFSVDFTTHK